MNSLTTRGELTLEQLARLLPASESDAIPETTAYLLNLVETGLLLPSRSETYQGSIYPLGRNTPHTTRTRHFFTWGDIAKSASLLPESLQNAPAIMTIIETSKLSLENTPTGGESELHPTPQITSRKPSSLAPTTFSKSQILDVDWGLPAEAPSLKNILEDAPDWVVGARLMKGKPGDKSGGVWNVVVLAGALSMTGGRKPWSVSVQCLSRVIAKHFKDALPAWEDWCASYA